MDSDPVQQGYIFLYRLSAVHSIRGEVVAGIFVPLNGESRSFHVLLSPWDAHHNLAPALYITICFLGVLCNVKCSSFHMAPCKQASSFREAWSRWNIFLSLSLSFYLSIYLSVSIHPSSSYEAGMLNGHNVSRTLDVGQTTKFARTASSLQNTTLIELFF